MKEFPIDLFALTNELIFDLSLTCHRANILALWYDYTSKMILRQLFLHHKIILG